MDLFAFTSEEDDYLKDAFRKRIKISRMAIRLKRDYDSIAQRLVDFGYILEKDNEKRLHCKYANQDEIEYDMLMDGSTEEDIEKITGCNKVNLTGVSCGGSDEED